MTADELIRANESPPEPTKVRIAHKWGDWAYGPASCARILAPYVDELNAYHGPGTHWLEFEA